MSNDNKLELKKNNGEFVYSSQEKQTNSKKLHIISEELSNNLGDNWHKHSVVAQPVSSLARTLYYAELYKKIVDVPGVICEFGVQWGATMALLTNLRSINEPFNISRVIHGFDTFEGFIEVDKKDGELAGVGDYHSKKNYEATLDELLTIHESFAPMNGVSKHKLIKGDASLTIDKWLKEHPHVIISMVIFDMDLYKPTKAVLEKILPRLTKGSLLVFDELNCEYFPGETRAVEEVLGFNNIRLKRSPLQAHCAWAVFGE